MRALESREAKEKRDLRNKTILGLFIIFIMVFSTVGYALWWGAQDRDEDQTENPDVKIYGNYTFTRTENIWLTEFVSGSEKIQVMAFHLPDELNGTNATNITIKGTPLTLDDFYGKAIYLVADDDNELMAASSFSFLGGIAGRMQRACLEEEENDTFCLKENLPIRSCGDADEEHAVIIVKETDIEPRVIYDKGCLTVKGIGLENLTMASDKALFQLLGILE